MITPLRAEREKRDDVAASQVAKAVGIDQSYYSKIELGKIKPSAEIAERIALYFGHAVSEMQILYPERFPAPGRAA